MIDYIISSDHTKLELETFGTIVTRFYCAGGECMWIEPILIAHFPNYVDCTDMTDEELAYFVDSKHDRAIIMDAAIMEHMTRATRVKPAEWIKWHELSISWRLEDIHFRLRMGPNLRYKT